jgi:hypothetical protein
VTESDAQSVQKMPSKTFDCAVSRMDQDAEDIDICDALGMDFDAIAQEEDAELGWCAGTNAEQGESDSESSAASSAREHGAFQEQTSAPEHRSSKEIPQAQTQVESIAMHESAGDVKVDTVPVTVPDSGAIAHLPDDEQVASPPDKAVAEVGCCKWCVAKVAMFSFARAPI